MSKMKYTFWQTRDFKKSLGKLKISNQSGYGKICRQVEVVERDPYSYAPKLKDNTWGNRNVRKIEIGKYRILYELLFCGICEKNPLTSNECETIDKCKIRVVFGNIWTHEEYNHVGKNKKNTPIFLPHEEMPRSVAANLEEDNASNNNNEHSEIENENTPEEMSRSVAANLEEYNATNNSSEHNETASENTPAT